MKVQIHRTHKYSDTHVYDTMWSNPPDDVSYHDYEVPETSEKKKNIIDKVKKALRSDEMQSINKPRP